MSDDPVPTTTTTEEKKETTSIFGSSLSNNTTFGSVGSATTPAADGEAEHAPDHEPNVEFTPKLNLQVVEVKSNEEEEDVIFKARAKLYRHVTDPQPQWNERGVGEVKFLKHQTSKKIRISMRREKILKVCLNHYISPILKLEPSAGSDKSWVWKCPRDYSDTDENPEGTEELFAIRFTTPETAQEFKKVFEQSKVEMGELLGVATSTTTEEKKEEKKEEEKKEN